MSGPVLCDTGCCIVCPEMYFCTSKQFNKAHQYSFSFDIKQLLPNLSFFSLWGWLFFFFWIFFLLHISKYTTVLNKFIFKVTLHASSVSTVINCRTISVQPMWKRYKVWLDAISWGNDPQQWIKRAQAPVKLISTYSEKRAALESLEASFPKLAFALLTLAPSLVQLWAWGGKIFRLWTFLLGPYTHETQWNWTHV